MQTMEKSDVQAQLMLEFRKVIAEAVLFNEQIAVGVGMNGNETQSIHLLQLHGPLTPSELARFTGLTSGSMTAVLDRLEKLGFVQRQPHPTDRRKVVVRANEKHIAAALAPYYKGKIERTQAVMNGFNTEELAVVTRFLHKLTEKNPN